MNRLKLVLVLVVALLLSGCDFSISKAPLPGGADVGDNPMTVHVTFPDVLDLVPQSTVRVNDVTVGKVTDITLDGYVANVTLSLRNDVDLPDNAEAEIRQTSLLGEKFVSLKAPENPSSNKLSDGDDIALSSTNRNPEVEEVLGALSLLLNGGGVAQLKTISSELNKALEGREGSARSVLTQLRVFTRQLDDNKADIVTAIESLDRLARAANAQKPAITSALDDLPGALDSLDSQRADLIKMLKALGKLGNVGTRVIRASKTATIDALTQLQPVLTNLAATGDDFAKSFNVFLTYPFVDEVVGRDPEVARNLHMGDYTNLSIKLDIDVGKQAGPIPDPSEACIPLGQIPDDGPLPPLDKLCDGAVKAIQKCLDDPTVENCRGLPDVVVDRVCKSVPLPGLCPGGGGGGDNPLPLPTSLPDLGLGLSRPAALGDGNVSMSRMMDTWNPILVALLMPGVAQ
ncbi:MCE family protein [Nocardioides guangzhouensis]|uniref:MCE family protein n=1 Tax=Nocardioides guangzhouensis TaxID=2497878 RepID=A0A4Q4Z5G0_9ACTN|nr:MCE family protein [Nocardioides guangzhouensis]RYP82933.1 MCE family protein [Nocardioides guangzhouensis]